MVRKIMIVILLFGLNLDAQKSIDEALSYLQNFSIEENEWENITIVLEEYIHSPLKINNLKIERVKLFPLLNQRHFLSIKKHIRINGSIYSKFELYDLPFFNKELVDIISPFLSFVVKTKKVQTKLTFLHKTNFIAEQSKGFLRSDSNRFLGTKNQEISRLKLSNNSGMTAAIWKKDKGEKVSNSFVKFGYQTSLSKAIEKVNIGAYSLHLGEGLIHSNKFIIGKSAPLASFYKISHKLNINASSSEANYENGLAFQIRKRKIRTTIFYSGNFIDGVIDNDTIRSIKEDGLFRTNNDTYKKRIGKYKLLGTSLDFTYEKISFSYNTMISKLSSPYYPPKKYYNFNYNYSSTWNNSISYRFFNGKTSLKGEIALDKNIQLATNHFFVFNVNESFNFLINSRYLSKAYSSFRANTFSEGTRVQNEKGCMFAIDFEGATSNLYFSADYFAFPNPKFLVHLPSIGKEFICFFNKSINDSITLKVFYKNELKAKNQSQFTLDEPSQYNLQHFYSKLKIKATNKITFTTRVDFTHHKHKDISVKGRTVYFDMIRKQKSNQLSFRITLFNTHNWDTRIYIYEQDLLYHFSIPALYDQGTRLYINYNHKLNKNCKLWAKVGRTVFSNKTSIGSGNDEILGDFKTEIRFQLQYNF